MKRRQFIQSCGAWILLSSACKSLSTARNSVKFGLLTDSHYARQSVRGSRYYDQSIQKMADAVKVFNSNKLDFIIELGDFKDMSKTPDKQETLTFLNSIEHEFQQFDGPVYHVLGNHDMDCISKHDFLLNTTNYGNAKGKTYYSFICQNIKFIILDANFNPDDSDYSCGNFDWTYAKIPENQKQWLQRELQTSYLVVVFVHQLLDSFSNVPAAVCIKNAEEITEMLEESNQVIAVFQGHHHKGSYSYKSGIHYYTMKAMIEGSMPQNNAYAIVEIDTSRNIIVDGYYNCEDMRMNYVK
jgi:alkaline phosphatase